MRCSNWESVPGTDISKDYSIASTLGVDARAAELTILDTLPADAAHPEAVLMRLGMGCAGTIRHCSTTSRGTRLRI